jgi:hydroxyacylglutathione hydrolase
MTVELALKNSQVEEKRKTLYPVWPILNGLNGMKIQTFTVGRLSTNCYVVHSQNTTDAIVIDPGFDYPFEAEQIFHYVDAETLTVKFVVNTHGHSDHISGDQLMQKRYHVPVCIHEFDAHLLSETIDRESATDVMLKHGSLIEFGDEKLRAIHTPGHTKGSICLLADKVIFTGDTLFAGGIGRTDFPGSSYSDMMKSLEKLQQLPESLVVYPGHGPPTLIGEEKRSNPFLSWV